MLQPQQAAEPGSFGQVALALESRIQERVAESLRLKLFLHSNRNPNQDTGVSMIFFFHYGLSSCISSSLYRSYEHVLVLFKLSCVSRTALDQLGGGCRENSR